MHVRLISELAQLDPYVPAWRELARDTPFAGPDWLLTWWQHFGPQQNREARGAKLFALCLTDEQQQLVAIAPWYVEPSRMHGRTVRFLGSGIVCSDYLTVPCIAGQSATAARAIADWLSANRPDSSDSDAWDLLSLEGVDLTDTFLRELVDALCEREAITHLRPATDCWRLELPNDWEELLKGLSKSHRKQLRRLERAYADRVRLITAQTPAQWSHGFSLLVDLHNRRWAERGIDGVFASPELYAFHRDATERLLAAGQLRLTWLEVDGQPVAADYALAGGKLIYAYQSGMDPAAAEHEPGTLSLICTLQELIAGGQRGLDLLRGDEPYKLHWRATQRPMHDVRILPGDWPGRLRQSLWQAATGAKDWLRASRDAMFGAPADAEL